MIRVSTVSEIKERFKNQHGNISRITYASEIDGQTDYALINHKLSSDTWIVYLHGHGSHEDQFFNNDDLKTLYLKTIEYNVGILSPNLRDDAWMRPEAVSDLHSLLDFIRKTYKVSHFIFIGGSMGGTGVLIYSMLHPEDVESAVVLGAASDLPSYLRWCKGKAKFIGDAIEKSYKNDIAMIKRHSALNHYDKITMPLFTSHGGDDALMPVSQMRKLAEVMRCNNNFVYMEIKDGNHGSPLEISAAIEWAIDRI